MKTERSAIIATIFISACWGIAFIFTKWGLQEMDTYTFLFLRFSIASLLCALIFFQQLKAINWPVIKAGAFAGSMLTIVLMLQTEGLRYTTASNSALITGLYLVLTPLFLAVTQKIKIAKYSLIGSVIAFAGLYLLTQYNFQAANFGDLLTLFCSFGCVAHILAVDATAKRYPVILLALVQFATVAICTGVVSLFTQQPSFHYSQAAWGSIFFTAIFATIIAFGIQIAVQRVLDPTRAGIIFALEAVFGTFFGWWLGDEIMSGTAFAGACLMVSGMVVAEAKPLVKIFRNKLIG